MTVRSQAMMTLATRLFSLISLIQHLYRDTQALKSRISATGLIKYLNYKLQPGGGVQGIEPSKWTLANEGVGESKRARECVRAERVDAVLSLCAHRRARRTASSPRLYLLTAPGLCSSLFFLSSCPHFSRLSRLKRYHEERPSHFTKEKKITRVWRRRFAERKPARPKWLAIS